MIVMLKDAEGLATLFNTDHVVLVSHVRSKGDNVPVIGKCAIVCVGGAQLVVQATVEEVYGLMRRGEPRLLPLRSDMPPAST